MLIVYAVPLFLSGLLVFWVQPMFARLVLPWYGGTPAVWSTMLAFFQAALLMGYLYGYLTSRLGARRQIVLHLALMFLQLPLLPLGLPAGWLPAKAVSPGLGLVALLLCTVAMPFFVVSTTSPLLQRWFAQGTHRRAADPYFLYSVSNAASLVGLISYPVVMERALSLQDQARVWMVIYVLLCVTVALASRDLWRAPSIPVWQASEQAPPLRITRRARWVALALVPSSLMSGVTTYISTDLASIPLWWVVPLVAYLGTFIVAFSTATHAWRAPVVRLFGYAFAGLTLGMLLVPTHLLLIPLHLLVFVLVALVCHGALADDRPDPRHLAEFYVWVAVGGALGGSFNAFVAPLVFTSVAEYPVMLLLFALWLFYRGGEGRRLRPDRLGLIIGCTALAVGLCVRDTQTTLFVTRTFYGTHRVVSNDEGMHTLLHGTTAHGMQYSDAERRLTPQLYYAPGGPLHQLISTRMAHTVAVVGLGAGSTACHGKPTQAWTFYELDPAVAQIARDPALFTFLRDCPPRHAIVLGDARLSLAQTNETYDILVLDAYTSDAVPTHLLTREALRLYLSRLAPGGLLLFHITNRYYDLVPVLSALARDAGLAARLRFDQHASEPGAAIVSYRSKVIAMARTQADLGVAAEDARWQSVPASDTRLWTDDYANPLDLLVGWP